MQLSDSALILACRRGDAAAWELLIRRYDWLLVSVALRAGLDSETAAEVAQGVFVMLLERLDRIEQPSRLRAWLVTTARRETWRLSKGERLVALHLGHTGDDLL